MGPRRSALLVLAVLAALTLCCAAPALALQPAGNGWYWQLPQPQGQQLNSVTMPDAQDAWAAGNGGVIMHSTDGGASWAVQSSPTTDPLAGITFSDAQHGCAVGGLGWDTAMHEVQPLATSVIVFTSDGGSTWQTATQPSRYALTAVAFVGQDGWAVGQHGTILHSADGGATWVRQRSGVVRALSAVTFTDSRRGFAAGTSGVFVTTVDGGLTWTRVKGSGAFFWFDCNSLAVDGAGTLWASLGARGMSGEFDRLASSADGGRHWRTVDMGWDYNVWDVTARGARVVAVGPADEGSAIGTSRIVSSADGGATWGSQVLGQAVGLTGVAIGSGGALCAVGTGSVWSTDGGTTWAALGLPVQSAGSVDFASPTQGWATGGGSLEALFGPYGGEATRGSVLHTTDGATWQEQLSEPGHAFAGVDFTDAQHGWVVGSGGAIRYTADGGATWMKQASGTAGYLDHVDATGGTTAWALGYAMTRRSGASVLIRTTDSGTHWLPVALPARFFPVTMQGLSGDEAWLAGVGKAGLVLKHTLDGGASWTGSTVPDAYAGVLPLALDFLDSQHGWLVGAPLVTGGSASVLLRTSDGGRTWTAGATDDAFVGVSLTAVDFVDAQHGWVAGDGIYATSDGGATWTKVVGGLGWIAGLAAFDQTHVWAGADGGGIVSTVDAAGDTAAPTTLSEGARGWVREATHLALSATDAGGSGVASTEYSLDGGAWQPYLAPLDFPAPADHSGDGAHSVRYRSADKSGLVEPVQSYVVRTDTVRPVIRLRPSVVGRDGVLRLRARIDDASTTYVDQFQIDVYRHGLRAGGGWDGFRWPTNRWRTFRDGDGMYDHFAPGWYRVRLYATDPAGNKQIVVGKSVLLIKRRPGKGSAPTPVPLRTQVYAPRASALDGAAAGWMPAEVREVFTKLAKHLR